MLHRVSAKVPLRKSQQAMKITGIRAFQAGGKSKYKDTETRSYLVCSKDIEVFGVAGAEGGIA